MAMPAVPKFGWLTKGLGNSPERASGPGADQANIHLVDRGIVAPVSFLNKPGPGPDGKPRAGSFDGGLFNQKGLRLPFGDNAYLGHENKLPRQVDPRKAAFQPGTYLYLGMVQNVHFGHFISESLSRIWGADLVGKLDGVIIQPIMARQPLMPYIVTFLDFFLPGANFVRPLRPTCYERILVPDPIRFPPGYMRGGSMVRSFFHARTRTPELTDGKTPKRLFVSRAALRKPGSTTNKAGFVCEAQLDELMRAEGYTVFYPEQHSPAEQLRHYNNAEELVFAEGSTIHLYVLTARPGQKVYFLWRRKRMAPNFEQQLTSFTGERLRGSSKVTRMFYRRNAPGVVPWALSELDFDALRDDLVAEGMISGRNWVSPSAAEMAEDLERQAEAYDLDNPF